MISAHDGFWLLQSIAQVSEALFALLICRRCPGSAACHCAAQSAYILSWYAESFDAYEKAGSDTEYLPRGRKSFLPQ
jgi:hypothetical protein